MLRRYIPIAAVLALIVLPASLPAADADLGLTIYYGDFALVRQHVDRILEAGNATVRIEGLPTSFDPTSLVVLNPEVVLLGARDLRTYQGSDAAGASLALDLQVNAPVRGLDLAYVSSGLGWSASYNLLVAPDDASGRIDGYAEIYNRSGAAFDAAVVQLLAGQVNFQDSGRGRAFEMMAAARAPMADEAPQLSEQAFAGYHLYDVSETLDLAAGSSRRIRMLGADRVVLERQLRVVSDANIYERQVDPERRPVAIRYRVARPAGDEFADTPLPSGPVRVLQPDAQGRVQLLGVASIPDSPAGEDLVLAVGTAFDVIVERQQTAYDRLSREMVESAWRVQLRNGSERDVTVEVIERIPGDWTMVESNREPDATTARTARFVVEIPARGQAELTYRVQVRN